MLIYTIAYIVSFILSRISFNEVSGIVLIFAAIYIVPIYLIYSEYTDLDL